MTILNLRVPSSNTHVSFQPKVKFFSRYVCGFIVEYYLRRQFRKPLGATALLEHFRSVFRWRYVEPRLFASSNRHRGRCAFSNHTFPRKTGTGEWIEVVYA
jgi:hypothetical protein